MMERSGSTSSLRHNNSPGDVLPGQKKGGQPQPVPRFVFYTVNVYASIVSYKVFAYKHK